MNGTEILMKAVMPVLAKGLTIFGKEISKKALIITGCTAGGVAVAGGVTAGICIHNHNKKKLATEAPSEPAGAEQK